MVEFLFSFYLLISIVCYMVQAPLWRHAYSSFFRLPDSGEEAHPCKGKCFSKMLKLFWAAEKTSCCWLEPTKIRRGRIGKETFRPTASPVAGNPAVRGQSYGDKRLWNSVLSKPIAAYRRNMLPVVREVIQLPLFPCLFASWFKKTVIWRYEKWHHPIPENSNRQTFAETVIRFSG